MASQYAYTGLPLHVVGTFSGSIEAFEVTDCYSIVSRILPGLFVWLVGRLVVGWLGFSASWKGRGRGGA